jgi:hypothetical protein
MSEGIDVLISENGNVVVVKGWLGKVIQFGLLHIELGYKPAGGIMYLVNKYVWTFYK